MKRVLKSILLVAGIGAATGCTSGTPSVVHSPKAIGAATGSAHNAPSVVPKPRAVTETEAIQIARQSLVRHSANLEPEIDVLHEADGWIIAFWDRPDTPGGFTIVQVSNDGKIIAVHPGL